MSEKASISAGGMRRRYFPKMKFLIVSISKYVVRRGEMTSFSCMALASRERLLETAMISSRRCWTSVSGVCWFSVACTDESHDTRMRDRVVIRVFIGMKGIFREIL